LCYTSVTQFFAARRLVNNTTVHVGSIINHDEAVVRHTTHIWEAFGSSPGWYPL